MATKLDDGLAQRLQDAALDETVEFLPAETIGKSELVPEALDATLAIPEDNDSAHVGGDSPAEVCGVAAGCFVDLDRGNSLPRIAMRDLDARPAKEGDGTEQADLRFEKILGEGGMGRVHLARQNSLRRHVAVKTLKEGAGQHAYDALLSEARVTGFLSHPGIIPVHNLGLDQQNQPVLVMKRIEGVPWKALLDNPENPAWSHWESRIGERLKVHLEILGKICDAVHFAHSQGVVHRDIKPENVMLGKFGEVYLVDWGLAISLDTVQNTQLVGTPAYIAPEMVLGQRVDARTDVYLLGATLHEILTGQYLHVGDTIRELMQHAIDSEAFEYSNQVPAELAAICTKATSQLPEARQDTADAFRQDIVDYLAHRSSIAVSDAAFDRLQAAHASKLDRELGPQECAHELGAHGAEARFGFEEALKAWPENAAAREGLEDCIALLVDAHLLRRDPIGAQALLQQMQQPPTDLQEQVDVLSADLERERSDQDRLKKLDRDLDETMGFRERFGGFLLILLLTSGTAVYLLISGKGVSVTNRDTVLMMSAFLGLAIAVATFKREKLFANAFNRRLIAFVLVGLVALLFNRLLAWKLATPLQQALIGDMVILAACAGLGGFTVNSWIKWMAPILMVGAVTIAYSPGDKAATIFAIFSFVSLFIGGLVWVAQARAKQGIPSLGKEPSTRSSTQ